MQSPKQAVTASSLLKDEVAAVFLNMVCWRASRTGGLQGASVFFTVYPVAFTSSAQKASGLNRQDSVAFPTSAPASISSLCISCAIKNVVVGTASHNNFSGSPRPEKIEQCCNKRRTLWVPSPRQGARHALSIQHGKAVRISLHDFNVWILLLPWLLCFK